MRVPGEAERVGGEARGGGDVSLDYMRVQGQGGDGGLQQEQ